MDVFGRHRIASRLKGCPSKHSGAIEIFGRQHRSNVLRQRGFMKTVSLPFNRQAFEDNMAINNGVVGIEQDSFSFYFIYIFFFK